MPLKETIASIISVCTDDTQQAEGSQDGSRRGLRWGLRFAAWGEECNKGCKGRTAAVGLDRPGPTALLWNGSGDGEGLSTAAWPVILLGCSSGDKERVGRMEGTKSGLSLHVSTEISRSKCMRLLRTLLAVGSRVAVLDPRCHGTAQTEDPSSKGSPCHCPTSEQICSPWGALSFLLLQLLTPLCAHEPELLQSCF